MAAAGEGVSDVDFGRVGDGSVLKKPDPQEKHEHSSYEDDGNDNGCFAQAEGSRYASHGHPHNAIVGGGGEVGVDPQVFAVIEDGWYFASWVVGAAHIRKVDPNWPAVGSRLHHSVGPWPVSINDTTVVQAVERNSMIELAARAWPVGGAIVRINLEPAGPTGTQITMSEEVTSGPARVLPHLAQTALLKPRNSESLRRLADIAVGRVARKQP